MSDARQLRALYLCYLSLEDPLVHTQVVVYLRGLAAAGHEIHLVTFETSRLTRQRRREVRRSMAAVGIRWHGLRYHKRPSLPATLYDTAVGSLIAALLILRHRLNVVHARSHVPAAMAMIARTAAGPRRPAAFIFDIRGLMAEEYEDAGRWKRGGMAFALTKAVERSAIRRADGIVVLTERVRRQLFGAKNDPRVSVIPCCADLDALESAGTHGRRTRAELGLDDSPVMIYVGKFGGWYMDGEMARFFAVARRDTPDLHFLILTQGDPKDIREALQRHGVDGGFTITGASPERLPMYLAAADFGIAFIRPSPSKISSSPTKVGEYLGSGLPVLATAGVGDLDTLITPQVGVLVHEHSDDAYLSAAAAMASLAAAPETRQRCQELARRELSLAGVGIPRYRALYEYVAGRSSARLEDSVAVPRVTPADSAPGEARTS